MTSCLIRQKQPRDIFVTAFDSSPLAPHLELAVADADAELAAGVQALKALTAGKVYIYVCRRVLR